MAESDTITNLELQYLRAKSAAYDLICEREGLSARIDTIDIEIKQINKGIEHLLHLIEESEREKNNPMSEPSETPNYEPSEKIEKIAKKKTEHDVGVNCSKKKK